MHHQIVVYTQFEKSQSCWNKLEEAHERWRKILTTKKQTLRTKTLPLFALIMWLNFIRSATGHLLMLCVRSWIRRILLIGMLNFFTIKKEIRKETEETMRKFDTAKAELMTDMSAFQWLAARKKDSLFIASYSGNHRELEKLETDFSILSCPPSPLGRGGLWGPSKCLDRFWKSWNFLDEFWWSRNFSAQFRGS